MFNELIKQNGLEYEEIKKLMAIKAKKKNMLVFFMEELDIHGRIGQEEAIDNKVN